MRRLRWIVPLAVLVLIAAACTNDDEGGGGGTGGASGPAQEENTGTVNVTSGTLALNNGGNCGSVCDGDYTTAGVLIFNGGTFVLGPGADITGAGTVDFGSGTTTHSGTNVPATACSNATFPASSTRYAARSASAFSPTKPNS